MDLSRTLENKTIDKKYYGSYQEAIGKDLNASVTQRSSCKFKITKVTREDLRRHGHKIVNHVNHYSRSSKEEEEFRFDPRGKSEATP